MPERPQEHGRRKFPLPKSGQYSGMNDPLIMKRWDLQIPPRGGGEDHIPSISWIARRLRGYHIDVEETPTLDTHVQHFLNGLEQEGFLYNGDFSHRRNTFYPLSLLLHCQPDRGEVNKRHRRRKCALICMENMMVCWWFNSSFSCRNMINKRRN